MNLLAEGVARFLIRSLAQRFDSGPQWANRSGDPHIEAFGGFASQANTRPVDVPDFVGDAVSSQPERIGTEGVGFNDLRAGLEIVVVNAANQVRLRQIQFVIRPVDENAFGIKQRAHGAIA